MKRKCQNRECQKPLVRKRYPRTGKMESPCVFERRKFCDNSCSATSRHAKEIPTCFLSTEQVRRQEALNQWRAAWPES